MRPPIRRKTTAATAFALIRAWAATSTFSPVYWQVRNSALAGTAPTTVSAVMTLPPLGQALAGLSAFLLGDINLAGHRMVADPAKLVADDAEFAALSRRQRDDMLISRMNLNVDVGRLQRKAVLPVER